MSSTRHVWKPLRAKTRTAASRMSRRLSSAMTDRSVNPLNLVGAPTAVQAAARGSGPDGAVAPNDECAVVREDHELRVVRIAAEHASRHVFDGVDAQAGLLDARDLL